MTHNLSTHGPPTSETLQRLIDLSPATHYTCEPFGDYAATFVSDSVRELTGYDAARFLESSDFWISRIHPADRERALAGLKSLATSDRYTHEYRFLHADGTWRWMHDELRLRKNERGRPLEIIGSWLDVTARKQTEESLRASELRTRKLLSAMPDLIFRMDSDGRYLDYYASDRSQLALAPERFIGRKLGEVFEPDFAAANQRRIDAALETGELQLNDYRLSIHGEEREFEARFVPSGRNEVVVIIRDVTELRGAERALQASERAFRAILESAPDALLIVSPDGMIRQANAEAQRLFGYRAQELVGMTIEQLMPPREHAEHAGRLLRYVRHPDEQRMDPRLDLNALTKDGTEVPVEIRLSPIDTGDGLLTAASVRDVTERVRNEVHLTEAKSAADKANSAKSRFLATASHDLRQPLQSLALLNAALEKSVAEPKALDMLRMQRDALGRMGTLLNSLLDISKLDSGAIRPKLDSVPLQRVFRRMHSEFAEPALQKDLALIVESCPHVAYTDETLITQLLENLLSNAVRYTRAGEIRLQCRPWQNGLRIAVEDSGIGIPSGQLETIFDEFYRIEAEADSGGLGLGLSIVRRIADLLNLRIDVQSEPGRGSCFSFVVANDCRATTHTETAHAPSSTSQRTGTVLLVENDPSVLAATQMLLELEGFRVVPASSPNEAYAALKHEAPAPDLIVTDYRLSPHQTGLDVIATARERLSRPVPAILVTGDTALEGSELGLKRLRVLSKPADSESLIEAMREFL